MYEPDKSSSAVVTAIPPLPLSSGPQGAWQHRPCQMGAVVREWVASCSWRSSLWGSKTPEKRKALRCGLKDGWIFPRSEQSRRQFWETGDGRESVPYERIYKTHIWKTQRNASFKRKDKDDGSSGPSCWVNDTSGSVTGTAGIRRKALTWVTTVSCPIPSSSAWTSRWVPWIILLLQISRKKAPTGSYQRSSDQGPFPLRIRV